jgi:DNA helicase-2/ATP-dependent DNA helicase PcrA
MANEHATGTADGIGRQDHSITNEYRIVGPPGTGKTTHTSDRVRRAVERYGPDSVWVTSFSRAAAAELANCDLPINPDRLGTLHSHCFQALGKPNIAEAHVKDWNRRYPHMAITPVSGQRELDGEDSMEDADGNREQTGDSLLQDLNRLRGLMIDPIRWPANIRDFERTWGRYKRERGVLDFCDLIDTCLRDFAIAPNNPSVIFADEAQDLNVMQVRLLRRWGQHADYFVLAVDDDQTIYSFIGATPQAIFERDIPDDHKVILRQSLRVPRAVHRVANDLIHQVTRRQEKIYLPRPAVGAVYRLSTGTYKSPEYFMFLASCSYMLRPIIQVLRKNAVPFHNPYRKAQGLWNPLHLGRYTAGRRTLALLAAHPKFGEEQHAWTYGDMWLWAEWLTGKGIFKSGAKELLQSADRRQTVTMEQLAAIFEAGALASLLATFDGDCVALLRWWRTRVSQDVHNRIQFPADVAAKRGLSALVEEPQVVVGTIHSVKGGEADVVYVFPDVSRAGAAEYQVAGPRRDSVIRVFYVGVTRARETLYICGRETAQSIVI